LFWSQYFWAIVAATVGVALILLPEAVFGLNGKEIPPALLACIMMLYGISFLVMAFLKPSLSQHIDESLRRILRAVPGQQMALRDLVACVQQEYVFSETTLSQYISGLSSLEQITLAGTPLQICRLKGTKKAVACAQIQQIASPNLRQEVARVLPLLNEEQGDVGLYLLSETFEDTLICYLMIARAKGKLARTPGGKSPNQLSWPEMMWCLKDCGVSVDTVALSSLREKWRNRAYGIMPSASERQVLMKQAQVLAGFYINYTTLLDDLTHDVSSMR